LTNSKLQPLKPFSYPQAYVVIEITKGRQSKKNKFEKRRCRE